jgi:hypothetical protein
MPAVLNRGCNKTLVYHLAFTQYGFGSEINMILYNIAYANYMDRSFILASAMPWRYGDFYEIFDPQLEECNYVGRFARLTSYIPEKDNRVDHLITYRPWMGIWSFFKLRKILTFEWGRKIASSFFKLTPFIREKMEEVTRPVKSSMNGPYIAVHMRFGDKWTENRLFEVMDYIYAVERLEWDGLMNVFVATDTYSALEEFIRLRPDWNIFYVNYTLPTNCSLFPSMILPESNVNCSTVSGYYRELFLTLDFKVRKEATVYLLAELDMLRNADRVICTLSSNMCILTQLLRTQKLDTLVSLDEINEQWNVFY